MAQGATGFAPSLETVLEIALAARDRFPPAFAAAAAEVAVSVEEMPDEGLLHEMGLHDPYEITGVYEGIPLTEKSVMEPGGELDRIRLFRRPILDEWAHRGDVTLDALIAHVLIHEFAHHFGWSDADIAAIDPWWE